MEFLSTNSPFHTFFSLFFFSFYVAIFSHILFEYVQQVEFELLFVFFFSILLYIYNEFKFSEEREQMAGRTKKNETYTNIKRNFVNAQKS